MTIDPLILLSVILWGIACCCWLLARERRSEGERMSLYLLSIACSIAATSLLPSAASAQEVLTPTPPVDDGWLYGAGTMLVGVVAGFLVSQYKSWRERVLHDNREDWRDLAVAFADRLGLGGPAPGVIELNKLQPKEESQP